MVPKVQAFQGISCIPVIPEIIVVIIEKDETNKISLDV